MNVFAMTGNVGKEPGVRYFESGKVKVTFSIAVRNYSGESDWFDCEAWGKTAETIVNYVHKGNKIGISGTLKVDKWEDRTTGAKRPKIVLGVEKVDLLERKQQPQNSEGFDDTPF